MSSHELEESIAESCTVLDGIRAHAATLEAVAAAIVGALRGGHKVLACGNGGSAAEAQHLVTELVGRFRARRPSLPAIVLGGDAGALSCIANDFSFDEVFSRPLEALGRPGDVLFCLTTSGNPKNVLRALEVAARTGLQSVALLGAGGGAARGRATWEVVVESSDTARVQEAHLFIVHWLCRRIDEAFSTP